MSFVKGLPGPSKHGVPPVILLIFENGLITRTFPLRKETCPNGREFNFQNPAPCEERNIVVRASLSTGEN
jgi:hypothetical protein